jgi:methionyl-tRNA formyltransferase
LKVLLASSSEVSIEVLSYLLSEKKIELKCVVTNPDKATGRGQALIQNKVANWCDDKKVIVKKVENNSQFVEVVRDFDIDLIITVAYGHILKDELLHLPKYGCINLHYSLLPKYRGAAPVQWAILNGEQTTGVTVFQLDSGMDTGPIYLQKELEIKPVESTKDLISRLNHVGVDLIGQSLDLIAAGSKPVPQPTKGASTAPKFKKEDGTLNWKLSAIDIYNRYRAIGENPGVYTYFLDNKVKINHMRILKTDSLTAGAFQLINGELIVGTNTLDIAIENLTPAGRKMMSGSDFINGLTTKESLYFA